MLGSERLAICESLIENIKSLKQRVALLEDDLQIADRTINCYEIDVFQNDNIFEPYF